MFSEWGLEFSIDYLDSLLNRSDVIEFVKIAGIMHGLGTWRPKFGRFVSEEM